MNISDKNAFAALVLSLTSLLYAANHVLGRAFALELPPAGLSFWRWIIGALILLPLVAPRLGALLPRYRNHWQILTLLGFLIVGSTTLILYGLQFTTATNASLINASQPTITALLCWLFLREKLHGIQWLGLFGAFAGIILILLRGEWLGLQALSFNAGDLMVLVAIFGFATYGINIRRIPQEFTVTESLFAVISLGVILLTPLYLAESILHKPMPVTAQVITLVLSLALFVSVLAMVMWTMGTQLIGANRAAMYLNLLPIFGAVLAVVFLGETIELFHVLGGITIGVGMWLSLRSPIPESIRPPSLP